MKTLKEIVLGKCEEAIKLNLDEKFHWPTINGAVINWEIAANELVISVRTQPISTIVCVFSKNTPETDPVWPLAATVLGVGVEAIPYTDAVSALPLQPSLGTLLEENIRLLKSSGDFNKFVNDLMEVVGGEFRTDLLTTVKGLVALKNSKPDWVKEELKEMMRPSDDLLWAAYEAGFINANRIGGPIKDHGHCKRGFESWSKTLPPDTLKEDGLAAENNRLRDAISGIIGYYSLVSNQNETEKRTIEILGELMTPKP